MRPTEEENKSGDTKWKLATVFLAASTIGLLVATIVLAIQEEEVVVRTVFDTRGPPDGPNPCDGAKIPLENTDCLVAITEQAGANVTKGYNGSLATDVVPITDPYHATPLCPVNVHWHLGAEHYSLGEFDETGSGPTDIKERRRLAGKSSRQGFQCTQYDPEDEKFTKPFDWEHCIDMEVGQTYEVHWPHSSFGACGTPNQFQTPFLDGVFCGLAGTTPEQFGTVPRDVVAANVGVQAQTFIVVNDEDFYYPDLLSGMIVDGGMGMDIAMYTGSTTGTSVDNEICSLYSPVTWQVDRKCHAISASSFDKLCADMKAQRDDMTKDLAPHGSRELVADEFAAANHANLRA